MEHNDYPSFYSPEATTNTTSSTNTTSYNDQEIVILITSSITGVIFFIILCCCFTAGFAGWIDNIINNSLRDSEAEYGQRALRRIEEEKEKKKEDPDVRKEKLMKSFERNKVSLVVSDICFNKNISKSDSHESITDSSKSSTTSEEDKEENAKKDEGQEGENGNDKNVDISTDSILSNDIETGEPKELYLPYSKASKSSTKRELTQIPNCCAICLCNYDIGDTVIWSCNDDCNHAFHDECIIPWLVKNQNSECPCCRRQFTDLPPPDGSNFNNGSNPRFWWSIRSWFARLSYTFLSSTSD